MTILVNITNFLYKYLIEMHSKAQPGLKISTLDLNLFYDVPLESQISAKFCHPTLLL